VRRNRRLGALHRSEFDEVGKSYHRDPDGDKKNHELRYYESLVPEGESKPEGEFDPALGVSVPDEA
jgi:hypothetical protein